MENDNSPLTRWTATLLSRAANQMREKFEDRVFGLGLKSRHYAVLIALQNGPLSQIELGRALWIDRTTMVALVDDLARLGLVERARHPEDRRAYAVTLTEKGREIELDATRAADEVEQECFAALSITERDQLRVLLYKILRDGPGIGHPDEAHLNGSACGEKHGYGKAEEKKTKYGQ